MQNSLVHGDKTMTDKCITENMNVYARNKKCVRSAKNVYKAKRIVQIVALCA